MARPLKIYFAGNRKNLKEWFTFLMIRYGPDTCVKNLPTLICR